MVSKRPNVKLLGCPGPCWDSVPTQHQHIGDQTDSCNWKITQVIRTEISAGSSDPAHTPAFHRCFPLSAETLKKNSQC